MTNTILQKVTKFHGRGYISKRALCGELEATKNLVFGKSQLDRMPTYQQVGHIEANPLGMNRGTMVMMVSTVSRHRGRQGLHKGTSPSE